VTAANPSIPEQSSGVNWTRIAWAMLILATLYVCYFSHLGALGFVGPDEPRYAWIARDMAETGDWVTPRLYGKPWFEKPPLYYWGAAICFKLFGVSEVAARLPSAICALLATLAMAWLAWRIYGAETARWLLLLLPTTVGMIGFSHAAATDMPFSAMLTIAMVCAAVVVGLVPTSEGAASPTPATTEAKRRIRTPWLALLVFGFFLGLAVLAKGPAGIVLCGGAVFFWALFTKHWRDAFRLFHPAAIFAFCATALPWYVLCARRNPEFFRVFIIEHNFKRYLTPEFQHIQPFWFYIPVVLAALLPWTFLFLWSCMSDATGSTRRISDFNWLLFSWFGFTILFFTISKSKLPGYILPAIPPLGLFTAESIRSRVNQPRLTRWYFSLAGLTLILLGILAVYFSARIPFATDVLPGPTIWFAFLAVIGGSSAITLAFRRRLTASGVAAAITVTVIIVLSPGLWELDRGVSARPAVVTARERFTPEQLVAATTFKLRRAYKYQVDFYLQRETREWSLNEVEGSIIFTDYENSAEIVRMGGWCPTYVAFPAVWLCEYSRDGKGLMDRPTSSGQAK
jgi:4-amino-4-deoxy-L-arabinose transferase-like glycosyltransferase